MTRTTSFESNCKIESDPTAVTFANKAIASRYPGCRIEMVTDKARQLKGIDYIAHTPNGPINIDVKIRKGVESYWKWDGQDVLLEYKQGSAKYGWGTDPSLETDLILFLFPWGKPEQYKSSGWTKSLWLPHRFVRDYISRYKSSCGERAGYNGYAYSYCISPTITQLENAWVEMDYKLEGRLASIRD